MKMKNYCLVITVALGMFFSGCHFVQNDIKEGQYVAEVEEGMLSRPQLSLWEDKHFTFSYDMLSSYMPMGTYDIKNGKVIATTEGGHETYTFQIKDEETLVFLAGESTKISMIEGRVSVVDGAEFRWKEVDY